jgi:hypothetical protein
MVGWFGGKFSTPCKLHEAKFDEMAKSYPGYTFYKCDIDATPKVAYDAEVDDVPSIAVLPLG